MGAAIDRAVATLNGRTGGRGLEGTVKFVLDGEGSLMLDAEGAREGDGPADLTLTAEPETFQQILSGELNATSAFMTGKLQAEGDMGLAMRLASLFA